MCRPFYFIWVGFFSSNCHFLAMPEYLCGEIQLHNSSNRPTQLLEMAHFHFVLTTMFTSIELAKHIYLLLFSSFKSVTSFYTLFNLSDISFSHGKKECAILLRSMGPNLASKKFLSGHPVDQFERKRTTSGENHPSKLPLYIGQNFFATGNLIQSCLT